MMIWAGTASLAGLCWLVSCVRAEPPRGQYSVSFKIVAGKLAVDRDAFRVAPPLIKFEAGIRRDVAQAIAGIDPPSPSLNGNYAWTDYVNAFEAWAAANPDRLDLGTIFSSDVLFAEILKQTPDFGLVLNDEDIDPVSGSISFSILPLFDSRAVRIELPALIESRRHVRAVQLRKRLARLNGKLWSSAGIRAAIAPLYANLGLTPQVIVLPGIQTIQITEGSRIASILLAADQVPARDLDRLLWDLLDTRHFRLAMRSKTTWAPKCVLDFDRDLGFRAGDEPYVVPYQLQALQLLISPLGYTLSTQPSARTGASQYVDLRVTSATKKQTRYLGAGFAYQPGEGLSLVGNVHLQSLNLSGGGPSGTLGSGSYSAGFRGLSASANAGVTTERNRFLDGVKVNQQTIGEFATLQWELWRGLDGNSLTLQLEAGHSLVLDQNLNTMEPDVRFVHNDLTSQYPSHSSIEPRLLIGAGFSDCIVTANTHRNFDHWEYDLSGRFENAFGDAPIFELPSLGGADTVRGFRADDAIGRRLWSTQSELWHGLPHLAPLKFATFFDAAGAYQTVGSLAGLRAGLGTGLRLDLRLAVLKFDWAYGFGHAATGGSRGKFYVTATFPTH
jgi:hypothetical protein